MPDKDKLDWMDEAEAQEPERAEAEPEPEQEAQPTEEADAEPAEAEQTEEAEATGEETEGSPPEPEPESRHVPITALLDERDKRKKAEEELTRLRQEAEARQQDQKTPDPDEDPAAWANWQEQQTAQAIWNAKLDISEANARERLGDETVDQATEAFKAEAQRNPAVFQQLQQAKDPYGFVVNWHRKQSFLSEIGDDPDKWREAERERIRQEIEATRAQSTPSEPPTSLASAPGSGKEPASPGNAFDQIFGE